MSIGEIKIQIVPSRQSKMLDRLVEQFKSLPAVLRAPVQRELLGIYTAYMKESFTRGDVTWKPLRSKTRKIREWLYSTGAIDHGPAHPILRRHDTLYDSLTRSSAEGFITSANVDAGGFTIRFGTTETEKFMAHQYGETMTIIPTGGALEGFAVPITSVPRRPIIRDDAGLSAILKSGETVLFNTIDSVVEKTING